MKKPVSALKQLFDMTYLNNACREGTNGNPTSRNAT